MINTKKKTILLFTTILLICVCTFVLFRINETNDGSVFPLESVVIHDDYPVAENLEKMIENADIVVVGRYMGLDSTWNMARNPENIKEEDSKSYVEGWLYNFKVDDVLKGGVDTDTILINHQYSERVNYTESNAIIDETGQIIKEASFENNLSYVVHNPLFIEPELNVTYILFLLEDQNFNNYYAAIEPFAIKIDNGTTVLQSNLIHRTKAFSEDVPLADNRVIHVTFGNEMSIDDTISGQSFERITQIIRSN